MTAPLFQHRHYTKLASIIADLPEDERAHIALHFCRELRGTNPNYAADRFYAAAMGAPTNGRDCVR